MKKETEIKYPNSANLFQFCRRVLDHKFGGVRVIDQDVGQILGFDPADCSHWKKGKKNIRSIQAMKSIADHLGIDEKLVVDVASGEIDDSEAFYEFSGYGSFFVDNKTVEAAKKDFYRRNVGNWTRDKDQEFKKFFALNEPKIDAVVNEIHERIGFSEAPLYLPEIGNSYSRIVLKAYRPNKELGESPTEVRVHSTQTNLEISFPEGIEVRPFVRFQIAKAMAKEFLKEAGILIPPELGEHGQYIAEVQANLFAAKLLTPAKLIQKELANVNAAKDIVAQLAEVFWVSKVFMNRRLKDILQGSLATTN